MSEIQSNRFRVCVASEGTYKTDAVEPLLSTATAVIVYQDVRSATLKDERVLFNPTRQRAQRSGVKHESFSDKSTFEMVVPLTGRVGSGAGDEAPYYDAVLAAVGFKKTVVSATSATYSPSTVQTAGMTIYKWSENAEDSESRLQYTTGARGSATFNFAVNEEAYMSVSGKGIYTGQLSDSAQFFDGTTGAIALLKDATTSAPARTGAGSEEQVDKTIMGCKGMTVTLGGTTMPVANLEFDLALAVTEVMTMNGAGTVTKVLLGMDDASRPFGSFSLADGDAAYDLVRDAQVDDSEAALVIVLTDGTDTITITMPKVQIGMLSEAANGTVRTWDVPFFLNGDWSSLAADNELTIAYT